MMKTNQAHDRPALMGWSGKDPLEEVTSKQGPEGTPMLKAGRVLHMQRRACAKTLRRKGNLGTQRAHTADKLWSQNDQH